MSKQSAASPELIVDRRTRNRRQSPDRRKNSTTNYTGPERRKRTRRKAERRRQIDPTTCERDYNHDEIEFMKAMDLYKRNSGRQFPTWSEVLEVLRDLGYRKVEPPKDIYCFE